MEREQIPTADDYLKRVEGFEGSYKDIFAPLSQKFYSLVGYYQFIGPENATKLSHSAKDFVVDCNIIGFGPYAFDSTPCDRATQIERYMTAEYYSCYTIHFNTDMITNLRQQGWFIMGIEVTLYVDNFMEETGLFFAQKNSANGVAMGKNLLKFF